MSKSNVTKKDLFRIIEKYDNIIIPFYQREYTWEIEDIKKLVNDILENECDQYYLGTIVLLNEHDDSKIIDGQQRIITTLLVFKSILNNFLNFDNEHTNNLRKILNVKINFNNFSNGEILCDILKSKQNVCMKSENNELNYCKNYKFLNNFFYELKELNQLDHFYNQLKKVFLSVVSIPKEANEFDLFEQINSTGKKLTQFDLVKNFLFSKLWEEFDENESKESKPDWIDSKTLTLKDLINEIPNKSDESDLLRHFIATYTGNLKSKSGNSIYNEFKKLLITKRNFKNANDLFTKLCEYIKIYSYVLNYEALGKKDFAGLRIINEFFNTYAVLLIDVFSTNLTVNSDFKIILKNEEEIIESLKIIESYIIKRNFCGQSDKVITRYIPTIPKKIKSIQENMSYSSKLLYVLKYYPKLNDEFHEYAFPDDDTFKIDFAKNEIYRWNRKFCKFFLERLEIHYDKKPQYKNSWIEHILPQAFEIWEEREKWKESKKLEVVKRLHTIGNLTLLDENVNKENSNKYFSDKKLIMYEKDGFRLNNFLRKCNEWNIQTIDRRTDELLKTTLDIINVDKAEKELLIDNRSSTDLIVESNFKERDAWNLYEDKYGTDIIKNKSNFKKIPWIKKNDIIESLKLYLCELNSYEKIEKKIFSNNFEGYVFMSIKNFLKIENNQKNSETKETFSIKKLKLEKKIDHLIEFIHNTINES